MHLKMELYTHKLQEGGPVLNHISVFKEIVFDLEAMEIDYDDEDLGLILLCSLPNCFANFRDTLLYSHDSLTLDEVSEALHAKGKMKQMVPSEGSTSKGEALSVRGRTKNKFNGNRGKSSNGYKGRSKSRGRDEKFCKYCKKDNYFIEDCLKLKNKEKRTSTYREKGKSNDESNVSVIASKVDGDSLVAFAGWLIVMMNGFLISLLLFIYTLIEIGLSPMFLSKVEVLLDWVMTVHLILLALDLFKLRCMMALSEHWLM